LICGCPKPQPPHRDGDAARAPTPESACANIGALGCPEGQNQARCALVLAHIADAGLEPLDLACIANAASPDAARACAGGPACQP